MARFLNNSYQQLILLYLVHSLIMLAHPHPPSSKFTLPANHNWQLLNSTAMAFKLLILLIQMGQTMLESCEMQCQRIEGEVRGSRSKSDVYFSNLSAHLPQFAHQSEDLTKSKTSQVRNNQFLLEIKNVPSHYIEFVNYLFTTKKQFDDKIFPASASSIIWGGSQAENDWARLSDMNEEIARIYRGISSMGKTRVIEILEVMEANFPGCFQEIKPIYIEKVGLAICTLLVNGMREEVVIDDQMPTSHLRYYSKLNKWYFLVEKAFAKLLGNYAFVEEFSPSELFQEITGLPFEMSKRRGEEWVDRASNLHLSEMKANSFRDVFDSEKIYYLQGGQDNSDVYSVRIIKGHTIKSLPFHSGPHLFSLYRLEVTKGQKVSIRISFLNQKFETSDKYSHLPSSELKLYRDHEGCYRLTEEDTYSLGNNLYLGCPFYKLETGNYILYAKRQNTLRKATLVCYAGQGFKIKEIHSKQICRELLAKLSRVEPY